jgi:hypothetical protein
MLLSDETMGALAEVGAPIPAELHDRAVLAALLSPDEPDDEPEFVCYGTEVVEVDVVCRLGWRTWTERRRIIRTIPGPIRRA